MEWTGSVSKYRSKDWPAHKVRWRYIMERRKRPGYDGKRMRESKGGFKTRSEAVAAMGVHIREKDDGVVPSGQSVGSFLNDWLTEKRLLVAASTWANYRVSVTAYITPTLGDIPLTDVRPSHISGLYVDLLERIAPGTIRTVHGVLRQAMKMAVDRGQLRRSPVDSVQPPKIPRADPRAWNATQLRSFLDSTRDNPMWPAFYLTATTGMRREEVLGLRWSDIDLARGSLSVSWTLITVDGKVVHQPGAKTESSIRQVALDGATVVMLREHRQLQREERMAWEAAWHELDLVFCREDGTPVRPTTFTRRFQKAAHNVSLEAIGPHGLRHTWATLALQAGIHPKVVSERLGHSSIAITLDRYSHVVAGMDADAAETVGRLIAVGSTRRLRDTSSLSQQGQSGDES